MSDILEAIEKEKEYLSYRMDGKEPFHLVDAIKECGFDSIENYFIVKQNYQFENLHFDFTEIPPNEAIAKIFRMMEAKETKVLFVASKETFVFSGNTKEFNEKYCVEHNIPIYPLYTGGGTIVSTPGDFSLVICFPESTGVDTLFILKQLKEIFSRCMENVEVDGNDILLNGEKICGSVMYQQNGMKCFAAHFSFNDNSELIEKICDVSGSVKIPATINGLTVDEFENAVKTWLKL